MTREEQKVRIDSDELLTAIDDMRRAEKAKREEGMSTPAFHRLADEVEAKARKVWDVSTRENHAGDAVDTTDKSINDTPAERHN